VAKTFQHWQRDPDLAGLREEAALAKLPEAERQAFRQLWADVRSTLERAGSPTTPARVPAGKPQETGKK
jgi:hypothetical protein